MKSSLTKQIVVASAALIACASLALPSHAQVLNAFTTTPTTESDLAGYGLSGFEFTPTSNIDITALGFTALDLGGGDAPHVTLWNATAGLSALTQIYDTGDIIGSVTSTTDNTPATPGAPSFVSVGTPILLTAGMTYLITAPAYWAATYNDSTASGLTPNAALGTVTFLKGGGWNGWDNSGYTFSSLTTASAANTPGVADLQFSVVEAPEPSTYAMLGAGLLTLFVVLRRRTARATF